MPELRDMAARAVPRRIVLMWAFRPMIFEKPCRRGRRRRRIAPRRARAPVSGSVVSTTTAAALTAAKEAARPDIPTPASSSSMRSCSRRRIQISTLFAAPVLAATRVACRRMGPRRRWPVDNLYCITFRVLSGVKHGRTPRARRNFLPHERAREGPAPTPSTRTHNLNLSERRQVLGHDRLEGAAPRSPAQRHAPQRTL